MSAKVEFASEAASRIARWLDLMRTTDKQLLAGLRHRIGPQGDLQAAHRKWYADHMREHDEVVERIATRLASVSGAVSDGD
jgi:citrate synthase